MTRYDVVVVYDAVYGGLEYGGVCYVGRVCGAVYAVRVGCVCVYGVVDMDVRG